MSLLIESGKADYSKIWKNMKRTWSDYWVGVSESDPASELAITIASNPLQLPVGMVD